VNFDVRFHCVFPTSKPSMNLLNARAFSAFALAAMLAASTAALARTSSSHSGGSVSREAALGLYSASQKQAGFDSCTQVFPAKTPLSLAAIPERWKPQALCSNNFAVMHSALSKTPLVVIERLSKSQIDSATGKERTNQFYPDPRLAQGSRAELADFRGSSLDRGHCRQPPINLTTCRWRSHLRYLTWFHRTPSTTEKYGRRLSRTSESILNEHLATCTCFPAPSLRTTIRRSGVARYGCRPSCLSWSTTRPIKEPGHTSCQTLPTPASGPLWTMQLS
jgi:hypothetical protein